MSSADPQKLASKGGPTSTGGVILEGNDGIYIEGRIISSVGQLASCPVCAAGKGPIVAVGERTVYLPAGPAAREGDYVACGCPPFTNTLLTQQHSGLAGVGHSAPVGSGIALLSSISLPKSLQVIIERQDDIEKPGLAYKIKDKDQLTLFNDDTCQKTGEGKEHPVEDYSSCDTVFVGDDSTWEFFSYEEPIE
ncbi:PAAR domain-containing protein [Pseudomonas chlororaphis]|uniref:PAAR domain-containing protein n=1 Tax=Pseudomonas chlororaphis TaxID=587753 RepID=UPI0009B81DDE|nr:PAAR domain-containing protein [Pseudomonas chlororaphis]